MNHSNRENVSIDETFKSTAYSRLIETGERDRLMQHLRQKLVDCGWEEDLKKYCTRLVRERGIDNIRLEDLLTEVTPVARKNVPNSLRDETVAKVRLFLTNELTRNNNKR